MAFLCCCSSFSRPRTPDLTLSLVSSSNTFLNGLIVDNDSRKPIYSLHTLESLTSIVRQTSPTPAHHARNTRARFPRPAPTSQSLVASIQWPERSPHVLPGSSRTSAPVNPRRDQESVRVHFDHGSVIPLPRFLKRRSQAFAGTLHKFRIPGYPTTFKWKKRGRKYQLRATGIRSLLADLAADTLTAALTLRVYGAALPSHHNQDQPGAVASVLLDYIVLTALLLVTPLRDWTRFSRHVRSRVGSAAWGDSNGDDSDGDGDGDDDGDGDGDSDSDSDGDSALESAEWEEPGRFRWGRAGHGQQPRQDQRQRRGGQHRGGDGGRAEERDDEMREVANPALWAAPLSQSAFAFAARRRGSTATAASTDSSATLVTAPHPPIVAPAIAHATGGSAARAQEVVRRALEMDLERDLGDYPVCC